MPEQVVTAEQYVEMIVRRLEELHQESMSRSIEPNRCYTTEEAAIALRVSPTTVRRMVASGELPYRDIKEKAYIFMGKDIIRFLDSQIKYGQKAEARAS